MHGAPIRLGALAPETNYVFQYPFAATPCFLLRLARPVAPVPALRREDGDHLRVAGGVGPSRSVVAFSAICAHKLAYPTRDVSFIRYQRSRSATSSGHVIHCCADHSVYDPTAGARVVAGPAPQPLAAIVLEYDAARDEIAALGTVGAEQFDAFFEKYAVQADARVRRSGPRAACGRGDDGRARARRTIAGRRSSADDRPAARVTGVAIVVRDLRKRYARVEAVRGVTFAVREGTTTALLGGNGAGKTTTLSMLLGVLLPTAGAITVLGCDMLRDRHRVLPRMNFTSPYVDLPKRLTVRENLRVFADLYGVERARCASAS